MIEMSGLTSYEVTTEPYFDWCLDQNTLFKSAPFNDQDSTWDRRTDLDISVETPIGAGYTSARMQRKNTVPSTRFLDLSEPKLNEEHYTVAMYSQTNIAVG